MLAAFALTLCSGALDAGIYGNAFALHGLGGLPVWEQYRRHDLSGASNFPPVQLERDGGTLVFSGLRQGCNGPDCAFLAPGAFLSRVPGPVSPVFSPVALHEIPSGFDVRFALLEADPDGGLGPFLLGGGGDLGARMDPYFPTGVDGLMVHVNVQADVPGRQADLSSATCVTAASALWEDQRTSYAAELAGPTLVSLPPDASVTWGVFDGGGGRALFSVFANGTELYAWRIPADRLANCGNPDDGGYADGTLDLSRLVPVLYVGWSTFVDPMNSATATMSFEGYSPRFDGLPPVSPTGVPLSVATSLVDARGAAVQGVDLQVWLHVEGPTLMSDTLLRPGLGVGGSVFTPPVPGHYRLTLEVAGPNVAIEAFVEVVDSDGGAADAGTPDSGTSDAGIDGGGGDAGADGGSDAGALDAGAPDGGGDAGVSEVRRQLAVGCGCSGPPPTVFVTAVGVFLIARRRRRGQ